jgi:Chaperone of endosialidase
MSKSQPVTQQSTQQQTIDPWLANQAARVAGMTGGLPGYSAYTGAGPAGLTPAQLQALGLSQYGVGQGQAIAGQAYNPLNSLTGFSGQMIDPTKLGADTQALMNPYIQNVINPATAAIDRNTQGAINQSDTNIAAQHAFGGSRQGVASGVIAAKGALDKSTLTSNLMSQGYSQAQAAAMAEQQANQGAAQNAAATRLGAANALSGLGSNISGLNTQDIANLMATGGKAQDTQTAQNMFQYQKWLNDMQMPGQLLGQQASILGGLPHGGTTTGQQSQMSYTNPWMQVAGLGAQALGAFLSDRRLKTDIEKIGNLFDATPLYRYRYKGDPTPRVGVMADEVDPSDTLMHPSGYKMVDYGRVIERAAQAR